MRMLADRLVKTLTSLRLTVVLLAFAIMLVFLGTLAQVDEGLYQAQTRLFKSVLSRPLAAPVAVHGHPGVWPPAAAHFTRWLSYRRNVAAQPGCRAHLPFPIFGRKNRDPTGARRRHLAARRPVDDRHARARIANQLYRRSDQIVCGEPGQLRTGFRERRRLKQRTSRRHFGKITFAGR